MGDYKYRTICESELEDYKTDLEKYGYKESDFTLEEKDVINHESSLGLHQNGTVTVRCEKSKKENSYHTGHKTHWTADFENDLRQNFFQ